MLTDLIFLIATGFLFIFNSFLSAFNYTFPVQIINSIIWVFSYFTYLSGIFPIYDLIAAMGTIMIAWISIYVVKLFIMLIGAMPWIHTRFHLPQHRTNKDSITKHLE